MTPIDWTIVEGPEGLSIGPLRFGMRRGDVRNILGDTSYSEPKGEKITGAPTDVYEEEKVKCYYDGADSLVSLLFTQGAPLKLGEAEIFRMTYENLGKLIKKVDMTAEVESLSNVILRNRFGLVPQVPPRPDYDYCSLIRIDGSVSDQVKHRLDLETLELRRVGKIEWVVTEDEEGRVQFGPIRFGMKKEDVRAAIGQPPRLWECNSDSKIVDCYDTENVLTYYSDNEVLNSILFKNPAKLSLLGEYIFDIPHEKLSTFLSSAYATLACFGSSLSWVANDAFGIECTTPFFRLPPLGVQFSDRADPLSRELIEDSEAIYSSIEGELPRVLNARWEVREAGGPEGAIKVGPLYVGMPIEGVRSLLGEPDEEYHSDLRLDNTYTRYSISITYRQQTDQWSLDRIDFIAGSRLSLRGIHPFSMSFRTFCDLVSSYGPSFITDEDTCWVSRNKLGMRVKAKGQKHSAEEIIAVVTISESERLEDESLLFSDLALSVVPKGEKRYGSHYEEDENTQLVTS